MTVALQKRRPGIWVFSPNLPISDEKLISPSLDRTIRAIVPREVGRFLRVFVRPPVIVSYGVGRFVESARIDDYQSAGFEALIHAQRAYDPHLGVAEFSTYATTAVRRAIRREWRPTKKCAMGGEYELASLSREDEEFTQHFVDGIENKRGCYPERVWWRLKTLMPVREVFILHQRYMGFSDEEIADRLGLTAERIRQIRKPALERAENIIKTDSVARLANNAPRYCAVQMADAKAKSLISRPSKAGWWAWRDSERFQREWRARSCSLYVPPKVVTKRYHVASDWQDALIIAAVRAAITLGVPLRTLISKGE